MRRSDDPIREKFHKLARQDEAKGGDTRLADWEPVISIGTAAGLVEMSVSALRKYEKEGLLIYQRTESGRRMLCRADIKRIRMIKHMIQDLGLNIAGILRILALLPCWDLKLCSREDRRRCPAVENDARPCWTLKAARGRRSSRDCRSCEVYRYGAYCAVTMKSLLHHVDGRKLRFGWK